MTKRQKLNKQLLEKEDTLAKAKYALICDCQCHHPGIDMLHLRGCCSPYSGDVEL